MTPLAILHTVGSKGLLHEQAQVLRSMHKFGGSRGNKTSSAAAVGSDMGFY